MTTDEQDYMKESQNNYAEETSPTIKKHIQCNCNYIII